MGARILTFSPLLSRIDFISAENLGWGFSVESIVNFDYEYLLTFSKSPLLALISSIKLWSFNWIWFSVPNIKGLESESKVILCFSKKLARISLLLKIIWVRYVQMWKVMTSKIILEAIALQYINVNTRYQLIYTYLLVNLVKQLNNSFRLSIAP